MVIRQGDVFWAQLPPSEGSEPAFRRPVVVIQRDAINQSRFNTVVVIPLTSQMRHSDLPGNVLLQKNESNVPRASVVRCTHMMVVDKSRLTEKIGKISQTRLEEILETACWVIGK